MKELFNKIERKFQNPKDVLYMVLFTLIVMYLLSKAFWLTIVLIGVYLYLDYTNQKDKVIDFIFKKIKGLK